MGRLRMVEQDEACRWCLSADADLAWRQWGGEYVVHHALSNDTHRVTEFAGRLLTALLRSGALDLRSLAGECGADSEETAETLEALAQLDLVARC
jgi:PqqD family protein of HPr-rel-A system